MNQILHQCTLLPVDRKVVEMYESGIAGWLKITNEKDISFHFSFTQQRPISPSHYFFYCPILLNLFLCIIRYNIPCSWFLIYSIFRLVYTTQLKRTDYSRVYRGNPFNLYPRREVLSRPLTEWYFLFSHYRSSTSIGKLTPQDDATWWKCRILSSGQMWCTDVVGTIQCRQ